MWILEKNKTPAETEHPSNRTSSARRLPLRCMIPKSLAAIMGMNGSSGNYPAHNYSGEYSHYSNNYSNDMGGNSQRYSNRNNDGYSNNYSNGYSGNSLREHLEGAMREAKDDRTRDEIRRLMSRI